MTLKDEDVLFWRDVRNNKLIEGPKSKRLNLEHEYRKAPLGDPRCCLNCESWDSNDGLMGRCWRDLDSFDKPTPRRGGLYRRSAGAMCCNHFEERK